MSVRRLAPPELQPKEFAFTAENLDWAKREIAKYPEGRQASAVISLLWRAQEQNGGWLPQKAIRDRRRDARHGADPRARGRDLLHDVPARAGRRQSPCPGVRHDALPAARRGGDQEVCERRIDHDQFHVSADGAFSWEEVECLGACVNAPIVQIGRDTYEDLTPETFEKVLDAFARGEKPKPGPQIDRQFSAPIGGDTTLLDIPHDQPSKA